MKRKTNFKTILAVIGMSVIAVPTALSVVACGPNIVKKEIKVDLNTIIKVSKVEGSSANTKNKVIEEIIKLNQEAKLTQQDIKIVDFKPATYSEDGSATITAEESSNYTGTVPVTITALPLIKLDSVIKNTQVDGNVATDADLVLKEIARLNPELSVEDVEVKDFIKATELIQGSAKIVAKPNTKYTGTVPVTITSLPLIKLDSVIKNTQVDGNVATDADLVLKEIARLNPELSVDDVEIINFKPANYNDDGSATIIAKENTKYTGEVDIIIKSLLVYKLSDIVKNTIINGNKVNKPGKLFFEELENLNPNFDSIGTVLEDFKPATTNSNGSAILDSGSSNKYIGKVAVTITKIIEDDELYQLIKDDFDSFDIPKYKRDTDIIPEIKKQLKEFLISKNIYNIDFDKDFEFSIEGHHSGEWEICDFVNIKYKDLASFDTPNRNSEEK